MFMSLEVAREIYVKNNFIFDFLMIKFMIKFMIRFFSCWYFYVFFLNDVFFLKCFFLDVLFFNDFSCHEKQQK